MRGNKLNILVLYVPRVLHLAIIMPQANPRQPCENVMHIGLYSKHSYMIVYMILQYYTKSGW